MPLTGEMLKEQGEATTKKTAPGIAPTFISIGRTEKEVSVETETAASGHKFKKTAHGLATKDVVVLTELNTKKLTTNANVGETVAGLVLGAPYWVHEVSSSEFAIAYTKTNSESATEAKWVEYTAAVKVSTVFSKVIEGTVTARIEVKYEAFATAEANALSNPYENKPEVECNDATKRAYKWLLLYSAVSAGTFCQLELMEEEKELIKGDLYKVNTGKLAQNAYVV